MPSRFLHLPKNFFVKKFLCLWAVLCCAQYSLYAQTTVAPTVDSTVVAEDDEEELEDITVSTTRASRSIANEPTRVEFIAGEELDEKANMKPGDIRMVLNESTGIQTQQTSVTSGNALIRIQGLDGRYTQILKDGFPAFAGAAAGLGLLQTPPLDLQQVEVIKGSASTLYGGGAIAGLVNLVSKKPKEEGEYLLFLNATTARGLDANFFGGKRWGKLGYTVYAARNSNAPYDPSDVDFTAIPKFSRYTINPKIFWYPTERTTARIGLDYSTEDRIGGDLHRVRDDETTTADHSYFERNQTRRGNLSASLEHLVSDSSSFSIRAASTIFDRELTVPGYRFAGQQRNVFGEASFRKKQASRGSDWVVGLSYWREQFVEDTSAPATRDYTQNTLGIFMQGAMEVSKHITLELGVRGDYSFEYEKFLALPRAAVLVRFNDKLTSRIGGGLGYKLPTPFTEETERILYRGTSGASPLAHDVERSYGANADISYRTRFFSNRLSFSVNQLFFYTRLNRPLVLGYDDFSMSRTLLQNFQGHFDTRGAETNIKLGYRDFKLFLGYTYTNAQLHRDNDVETSYPLTPRNRINSVLIWEHDEKWKAGLEAYYFGEQVLTDGSRGKPYWVCGFMVEKLWEHVSIFINFENFLDARQTRFDTIYDGSRSAPQFRDVYAPLDGFVTNGGVKLRL